ncbi:MAG: DNA-binding MarR family transcriptional regulator [Chlamydiales bacterium]|jgi:DNA-binding MarR family transcriptional regulator
MKRPSIRHRQLALDLASAWRRLERSLDASLSAVRGVSFAEYRILETLLRAPGGRCSRVDLARSLGLTASGVTRALRPLEKIGVVDTSRSERDARLALASLTDAGRELVADASGVVDDVVNATLKHATKRPATLDDLLYELLP